MIKNLVLHAKQLKSKDLITVVNMQSTSQRLSLQEYVSSQVY